MVMIKLNFAKFKPNFSEKDKICKHLYLDFSPLYRSF